MRTTIHERLLPDDVEDVRSLFASAPGEFVPLEGPLDGQTPSGPEGRDGASQMVDFLSEHSFVLALGDSDEIIGAMAYVSREECAYVAAVVVDPAADHDKTVGSMFDRLEGVLISEAGRSTLCIGIWSTHLRMRKLMGELRFSLFSFDLDCVREGVDTMIFHRRSGAPQTEPATH